MLRRSDIRPRLRDIAVPTAVLSGELDCATSPELADEVASLIHDADYRLVAGAAHQIPVEAPSDLIAAIHPEGLGQPSLLKQLYVSQDLTQTQPFEVAAVNFRFC